MRIFSKLNSNEYNNQLEKILENKTFDESVKNLVQSYPLFVFNWLENTERLLEYLKMT